MAIFGDFLASCIFSEHVSDLHLKFALRPNGRPKIANQIVVYIIFSHCLEIQS